MSSQSGYGSSMLFQSINEDLNASLATADELSREFNSMLSEVSPREAPVTQTTSIIPRQKLQTSVGFSSLTSFPTPSPTLNNTVFPSTTSGSSGPYSPSSPAQRSVGSIISGSKNRPSSPVFSRPHQLPPPQVRMGQTSPTSGSRSDSSGSHYGQLTPPNQSPRSQRRSVSPGYRSPQGSLSYMDTSSTPLSPTFSSSSDQSARAAPSLLLPYDPAHLSGRISPRRDRSPSPRPFKQPGSSTLPRNFIHFRPQDEGMQRQKIPSKWNETDLDMSVERKPHNTYDKTEWLRPSLPSSSWRESNLDGPPPLSSSKKARRVTSSLILPRSHPPSYASLPRITRVTMPPERASSAHPPFSTQPVGRISIPPVTGQPRQRRPIPLSVIMRLQNPHWAPVTLRQPREGEGDMGMYRQAVPMLQYQPKPLASHPEHQIPVFYSEVLHHGDVDAELERLEHMQSGSGESPTNPPGGGQETEMAQGEAPAPRPLSPTRLQPVMAPEAQTQEIANLEELFQIRAAIPRALKRRGSVDQSLSVPPQIKTSAQEMPNQYRHLINKLFRRSKDQGPKGERSMEGGSSSSDGEEGANTSPSSSAPAPVTSTPVPQDQRNYNSILRSSRKQRDSSRRARLSPLVLLLDGSLVGELETVQKAVQEMTDPSQPNDEGITAVHNAICGGHYAVVDFLVRIGANVSSPDSHGWTPLHCAASCNDRPLCEFLVRSGAAVLAVTESDEATASQKCDPYAGGFQECESFLRGVEEAMGVENSGVLYALWSYPAQAPDELSFKEGDMVTILQKQEGVNWWWASLCGQEGFVPNNYFGLFPKVRPKSLC
ncbi:relA-associated inhibitor [Aplochiton taeniatus]